MTTVTVHDKTFERFIFENEILEAVKDTADRINTDYSSDNQELPPL